MIIEASNARCVNKNCRPGYRKLLLALLLVLTMQRYIDEPMYDTI